MRIGTRGSALALAQAQTVADALGAEIVVITTTGDVDNEQWGGARLRRSYERSATHPSDKAKWVVEIERALLGGEIDLAVHSAKDVPGELGDGLTLLASPRRADPRDALCGVRSLDDLAEGARVGTSSLRRASQLLAARPDIEVAELRGNVDTRLRRLAEGGYDAIVLAAAGLERLGRAAEGHPIEDLLPAAGQGTLALEARADRADIRDAVAALGDDDTTAALTAERALVTVLEADCDTPVGALAERTGHGWRMRGYVGRADGSAWLRDELHGAEPEALGAEVARRLLAAGAGEILGR